MTTVFRSKVDGKLKAIGLAMPCMALAAIVTGPRLGTGVSLLPVIVPVLVAIMVAWVVLSTYYEFDGGLLVVHSGPFCWRIPLNAISAVHESNSVRSGPALSLDRLEIVYGNGRVLLISPEDKAGFLAALHRRVQQLAS